MVEVRGSNGAFYKVRARRPPAPPPPLQASRDGTLEEPLACPGAGVHGGHSCGGEGLGLLGGRESYQEAWGGCLQFGFLMISFVVLFFFFFLRCACEMREVWPSRDWGSWGGGDSWGAGLSLLGWVGGWESY